ncbi:MAG TPA: 1-phosphofructokinase family hexose kinase [Erysipelotrichaceae bacterium]|nr:1-phosphofructokinase family hexose kinase [Erysipelotrichaceae bacterium]
MIVTVTLNPAIDYHIYVATLSRDKTNVMEKKEICCGGKGINVSRTLALLKEKSVATGFLFSNDAALFEKQLNDKYISSDFVIVEGSTRTNIKINQQNGSLIEINENNIVKEADFDKLIRKIDQYLIKDNIIILSGSLPQGLNEDSYLRLCLKAKERGCRIILDSSKKPLKLAYKNCDVIKPNKEEFLYLTELDSDSSLKSIARKIKDLNNDIVAVSLGNLGAIYKYKDEMYLARALNLEIKSTVGAGDAMVAALSYGLKNKKEFLDIVKDASAISALMITDFPEDNFAAELEELKSRIKIERLPI